jgi:hypothetical protein
MLVVDIPEQSNLQCLKITNCCLIELCLLLYLSAVIKNTLCQLLFLYLWLSIISWGCRDYCQCQTTAQCASMELSCDLDPALSLLTLWPFHSWPLSYLTFYLSLNLTFSLSLSLNTLCSLMLFHSPLTLDDPNMTLSVSMLSFSALWIYLIFHLTRTWN